jgi:hypothetical protein
LRAQCWVQSDWRRAADIISAVQVDVQSLAVLLREAKVFGRPAELVDEIPEVCLVEIHELVDVGKAERTTGRGRRWGRQCATKNMGEGIEEMREESAVLRFVR